MKQRLCAALLILSSGVGGCAESAPPTEEPSSESKLGFFDQLFGKRAPTPAELSAFFGTYQVQKCIPGAERLGPFTQLIPQREQVARNGDTSRGEPHLVREMLPARKEVYEGQSFTIAAPFRFQLAASTPNPEDAVITDLTKTAKGIQFKWNEVTFDFEINSKTLTSKTDALQFFGNKFTTDCKSQKK
jgi:hypothetical protein